MSNVTKQVTANAVLRDAYGNFVRYASQAQWAPRNAGVVTAQQGDSTVGQGIITRQTINAANTFVVASLGSLKDSVLVTLDKVNYSKIVIVTQQSSNSGIDSLKMRTDQDTTLFARGLRDDGSGIWDAVTVSWGYSTGMTFSNYPKDSNAWNFAPAAPDTGVIFIVLGSLRDTVAALFTYGSPQAMKLYPALGQPDVAGNMPYADTLTVAAGTPLPISAKLFSQSGQWLKGYERPDAPITWKEVDVVTLATTDGALDKYSGSQSTFTGYTAYQKVRITATFSENGITIPKSIIVAIIPAAPRVSISNPTPRAEPPIPTCRIAQARLPCRAPIPQCRCMRCSGTRTGISFHSPTRPAGKAKIPPRRA